MIDRGTMAPAKRELALKAIESDPDTSILLLSLKAGGVGTCKLSNLRSRF